MLQLINSQEATLVYGLNLGVLSGKTSTVILTFKTASSFTLTLFLIYGYLTQKPGTYLYSLLYLVAI
jgi:uncharacterized protein with PQ loop repeat